MSDSRSVPNQWVQSFPGRTMGQQLLPSSSSPPPPPPSLTPTMVFGGVPEVADSRSAMAATTIITTPTGSNSTNNHLTAEGRIGKAPKKRSRASRKGPTTLFNTDTANFRAMVQQFTGAPPPPFLSGSQPGAPLINFGLGGQGPYHHHQSMMMLQSSQLPQPQPQLQPQPSFQRQLQQQLMLLQGAGEPGIPPGSNRPPASSVNMGVSDGNFLEERFRTRY